MTRRVDVRFETQVTLIAQVLNGMLTLEDLKPGLKVRVRQRIDRREGDWTTEVVGTVLEFQAQKTGSWYAHSKDNKLWLYRLRLQKPDGEITTLTLDQWTEIESAA
jgi:hypothetical protein